MCSCHFGLPPIVAGQQKRRSDDGPQQVWHGAGREAPSRGDGRIVFLRLTCPLLHGPPSGHLGVTGAQAGIRRAPLVKWHSTPAYATIVTPSATVVKCLFGIYGEGTEAPGTKARSGGPRHPGSLSWRPLPGRSDALAGGFEAFQVGFEGVPGTSGVLPGYFRGHIGGNIT